MRVRFLVFILLFMSFSTLFSDVVIKKDGDTFNDFSLEMYEDTTASLKLKDIKKIQKFQPHSSRISLGYSSSAFWFRFRVKNITSSHLDYLIRFSENMADKLDCYIVSNYAKDVSYYAGVGRYSSQNSAHVKPKFQINLKAGEEKVVYLRLYSKYANFTAIEIINQESLSENLKVYDRYYTFYFGAIFSLLLYNLVLLFYSRDIAYLYYVLYGVIFLTWQMELNGFVPFDSFSSPFSYYTISGTLVPLIITFFIYYSRIILNTKEMFPKIDKGLKYTALLFILLSILSIINLTLSFTIINALATFIMPFMLFVGFKSYANGNKIALFYIVAQITFIASSTFFSLMADGYLEYNLFTRHALVVGSFIEITLFSLALGYRLRLLEDEKLEVIKKLNIELEEKIVSRTIVLTSMLDRTMEAIGIYENHILVETNDAAVNVYGYKNKDAMIGKKAINFVGPSSRKIVARHMRNVYDQPYEAMALKADGSEFPVLVRGSHYESGGKIFGMVAVLDLSSIKGKEQELILARKKAEEATEAKSRFLANMSHEIRTPMSAIMGMSKLMKKTSLDEKQHHYQETINSSASSLLSIINDILDFSKIEAGMLELDRVDFNLNSVITNLENLVEYKVEEKALLFEVVYKNTHDNLYGDSLRISQVLLNLLNNAIKFTSSGEVKIIITNDKDNFTFNVKDSGIGIDKKKQENLFHSFTQADVSTTRKYGGTGLGLSISKELIELMDGELTLESEVGVGSVFSFTLLLPQSTQELEGKSKQIYTIEDLQQLKGSTILLVEDNSTNQEIITGLLDGSGIDIDIANNGLEAIERYDKNSSKYELIFMDLQMPIMDGIEATKYIREKNTLIPIVALTANAMREDVLRTKEAKMNEHLNKPIDIEKLYEVLLRYITKKCSKVASVKTKTSSISLPTFKTIDSEKALKSLGNNTELYLNILKSFYENYSDFTLQNIEDKEQKRAIHTLKGLSANIGATSLYSELKRLEESEDQTTIENIYNMLIEITDELKNVLDFTAKSVEKVKTSDEEISEQFLELHKALKTKRPLKVKPILQKLDGYLLNESDEVLFMQIKDFMRTYKFKEAIKLLEGERSYA